MPRAAQSSQCCLLHAQMSKDRIHTKGLTVSGSEANIGAAVSTYVSDGHFKVAVVGSRGMGALKRFVRRF